MRKILVSLALFISSITLSQNNLSGTVTDGNEIIPDASVTLQGTNLYSITDFNGKYEILNIPDGKYEIIVSIVGYKEKHIPIEISNNETLVKDIILNEGIKLSEVVINSRIEGQAKALNTQKNRKNIVNIISKEQIERFPDANIGDALKRVAGINVQYDQGEARFANIRGTSPELSSVTVNGERVPSAEAEVRSVQLDLIPADMIESIELNKAVTPDMDADAIGGSINLVTKKASSKQNIKATMGSGYSVLAKKPIIKGKFSYSNRFFNNKIGLVLNASILDKQVRSDNIEADWKYFDPNNKDKTAYTYDFQNRQYYLERLRQSYGIMLDYKINKNNNIFVSTNYNWRNDWENRFRLRYKKIKKSGGYMKAEIRRQTKGGTHKNKRLEDQRVMSFAVGGKHKFNKIKIDWGIIADKASEDRPNERYISFRKKNALINLDIRDKTHPHITPIDANLQDLSSYFSLKTLSEEHKFTEEKDVNYRINFEFPILTGNNSSKLKIGGKYKNKKKNRENIYFEYNPIDSNTFENDALSNLTNQSNSNFNAGDYDLGSFVSPEFLGNLNLNDSNQFDKEIDLAQLAGNFNAIENVNAFYIMYNQNISKKWNIIGGLRYEGTNLQYQGKIYDGTNLNDSEKIKDNYYNILPGLHITYKANKNTNIRFAYTNTLARPNYYDLVPYQEIDVNDNLIKIGNPSLKATTSTNFDFLGEHFYKNVGIISAGIFYKDLKNVIADKALNSFEYNGHTYNKFYQPVNTGNAYILGAELSFQRRLDFLLGVLKNISFIGNYTYTYSELRNIKLKNREEETLPLSGTPKHITNVSFAYDTKKLDFRISYNFASKFIEEYSDEAFFDRWYDNVQYLDFNANYNLNKHWRVYASINNILNQPLRYYQGISERVAQIEYYGVYTKFGVKLKF